MDTMLLLQERTLIPRKLCPTPQGLYYLMVERGYNHSPESSDSGYR